MSERRLISTGSPFEKSYGYSRAVIDEPFAFVAGTTGYDYATMTMPESVADQAAKVAGVSNATSIAARRRCATRSTTRSTTSARRSG